MAADPKTITDNLDLWSSALLTKSTAGRGSNGRVEAYGIKKLRELILELAVRGKLVPQNPTAEPATIVLLKLIKRKSATLNPLNTDEAPFEPRLGWVWVNLGDIAEIERGGSPRPINAYLTDADDGLNWIKIGDTEKGSKYITSTEEKIRKEGLTKTRMVYPGDFLLTNSMSFGRPYITKIEGCIHDGWLRIHPPGILEKDFLYYLLSSPYVAKFFRTAAAGAVVMNLNADKVRELPIPIPPLAEQQQISAKVDELMTLCDQLEQQQTNSIEAHQTLVETLLSTLTNAVRPEPVEGRGTSQPSTLRLLDKLAAQDERLGGTSSARTEFEENWTRIADNFDTLFTTEQSIDQLKQTILQLAVMGKLVPQDPNDEPASVLLKRLIKQKEQMIEQGALKKDKSVPAPKEGEKLFELPIGWAWSRLPEIGELARGKSKHRPRNDSKLYSNGSIPMIQTGDVSKADPFIVSYTALYNEVGLTQSRLWSKGTMCITIAANIAETGILAFDACFPDSVVGFIPFDEGIDVKYFEYFMRTAKSHLQDFAPSTAQKNINLDILGQLLVPLPPVMELNRIVAKVNELMTLCDALKTRLAAVQATQIHLAEAIVEQAVA